MLTNIPIENIFSKALAGGGDFAELFAEETVSSIIVMEGKRIERINKGIDAGYGIRVVSGHNCVYGFTNDKNSLQELATQLAKATGKNSTGKPVNISTLTSPAPAVDNNSSDKIRAELVRRASNTAWKTDNSVKQVQVSYKDSTRKIWVVNSLGTNVQDTRLDSIMVVLVVAEKNGLTQTGYEPFGGTFGISLFDPEQIGENAANRALKMLSATKAPRGNLPVVISSSAGGTMIHEAVGHGLEADLSCQGMSVYTGKLGTQVASKLVTVVDDPTIVSQRGTFKFDDEGTPSRKTTLIENGILADYLYDLITAKSAGVKPTGNGRRESYRNRPIVRMTNTLILPGKDSPDEIIASIQNGLLVKKMGGGQVNTLNGDFVFEAQEAHIIENGQVGEAVRGATLIGNGPKVLMEIDKVGTDIGYGLGTCGKEGQGVPVGHGMPTIRIPQITVGGTN